MVEDNDPLVSFCLFSYNQENYIEKAIESVLHLKYNNMEIIISDDCSSDNTFNIISDLVLKNKFKHNIVLNRNPINLGVANHTIKVLKNIAKGEIIVVLGGDDIVKEDYIEEGLKYFEEDNSLMMLDFNGEIIDENGNYQHDIKLDFDKKIMTISDYLKVKPINSFAPGRMFRRCLIDEFEIFNKDCTTEDSVLVNRALLMGKLLRVDRIVIKYRIHQNNLSSYENLKKMNNEHLINQYKKDLSTAYSKKIIPLKIINILTHRYNLNLQIRNSINETRFRRFLLNRYRIIRYKIIYYITNMYI